MNILHHKINKIFNLELLIYILDIIFCSYPSNRQQIQNKPLSAYWKQNLWKVSILQKVLWDDSVMILHPTNQVKLTQAKK